jgi:hypothetical protein
MKPATLGEQRAFLMHWQCVCAECLICQLILNMMDVEEEE